MDSSGSSAGLIGTIFGLIYLAVLVVVLASLWKVYVKAGHPGWEGIVPIYNVWILLQIVGRPGWWIVLLLIPIVNFVVLILVMIDLAKSFGKSTGFGIGLALLGFVFFPMLAFGDATYRGPAAAGNPNAISV